MDSQTTLKARPQIPLMVLQCLCQPDVPTLPVSRASIPFITQALNKVRNRMECSLNGVIRGDMFIIFSYCVGLPNGETPKDGFLPTDRRTGRRGRRHRSSTRSQDGKNQALSSEKENIEVRSNDSFLTGAGKLYALVIVLHKHIFTCSLGYLH